MFVDGLDSVLLFTFSVMNPTETHMMMMMMMITMSHQNMLVSVLSEMIV